MVIYIAAWCGKLVYPDIKQWVVTLDEEAELITKMFLTKNKSFREGFWDGVSREEVKLSDSFGVIETDEGTIPRHYIKEYRKGFNVGSKIRDRNIVDNDDSTIIVSGSWFLADILLEASNLEIPIRDELSAGIQKLFDLKIINPITLDGLYILRNHGYKKAYSSTERSDHE